jgi:uncharacterized membrane protein
MDLVGKRFLAYLREQGGAIVSSQRAVAALMGCSRVHVHRVLHDLEAAGIVKLTIRSTGTMVRLADAAP